MGVQRSRGSLAAMERQAVEEERARLNRCATDNAGNERMAELMTGALAAMAAARSQGPPPNETPPTGAPLT